MRRWVVDFFNRHDAPACASFMAPDYTLRVGDLTLRGRDEAYVPAVQGQLDQFPGLAMTVHRVVVGQDCIALQFSEHGASGGPGGRVASWAGVAIYRCKDGLLSGCVAQEDYLARHRQLKSGVPDPVDPPALAPWDSLAQGADPQAEAVARAWLTRSWPCDVPGVVCDDEHVAGVAPLAFDVTTTHVTDMFSSGSEVCFHAVQTGHHLSGLAGVAPGAGPAKLYCAGILTVRDGTVRSGRVVRDRAGLRRALMAP